MANLIYSALASLDGYVADRDGNFDWAEPDEEVHTVVNDLARSVGTYLFGRRMYEVLVAWETMDTSELPTYIQDYARDWHETDKIVYSTTMNEVGSARTRLERTFDLAAVAGLKSSSEHDLSVGGPGLAAEALRAGLVDEIQLFLSPVIVGGGTAVFPDDVRARLDLLEERRFGNGTALLRYRMRS